MQLYREYPEKIEKWRGMGADVVNMDTSYFYAVSRATFRGKSVPEGQQKDSEQKFEQ